MPGFATRMLEFDGKVAFARRSGPRILIVWDGGVASQDFADSKAAHDEQDALPVQLSAHLLEKRGYTLDVRKE